MAHMDSSLFKMFFGADGLVWSILDISPGVECLKISCAHFHILASFFDEEGIKRIQRLALYGLGKAEFNNAAAC